MWNGNTQIATGTAYNGTAHIVLPDYYPSAAAVVNTNSFYGASASSRAVQYDLAGMISNRDPNFLIIPIKIKFRKNLKMV